MTLPMVEDSVAARAVGAACRSMLGGYLVDPWRWPRESDLVVDLVARIREELVRRGEPESTVAALRHHVRCEPMGNKQVRVPRVRTELKLIDAEGYDRTDVAVLRRASATVHFEPYGVRDVSLKANASDVEALVEVKVCPHLYVETRWRGRVSMWVDDLIKLHRVGQRFPTVALRTLLCVDTSLPLESAGLRYAPSQWARSKAAELADQTEADIARVWPLPAEDFHLGAYVGDDGHEFDLDFAFCDGEPPDSGLLLWAVGVQRSGTRRILLPSQGRTAETLAATDVGACCWHVTIRSTRAAGAAV